MKFKPLQWQNSHPYLLVDRMEDLTHPQTKQDSPKCDRTIALFGYLRGTHLKLNSKIHIPGCDDFFIDDITELGTFPSSSLNFFTFLHLLFFKTLIYVHECTYSIASKANGVFFPPPTPLLAILLLKRIALSSMLPSYPFA